MLPNHLVDRLLHELGDTELRVLLVTWRLTQGFYSPRSSNTLTYRLLCERTGRSKVAVIRAVRSLAARGYLTLT